MTHPLSGRPRRVLMLAPHEFLLPSGTPLSVYSRLVIYSELGWEVELLTYPLGRRVPAPPGVTVRRSPGIPFIRHIPIGPSFRKLLLDIPFALMAAARFLFGDHDLLHTHEEAGWMGDFLTRLRRRPHLYDMHSSLSQQLKNYGRFQSAVWIAGVLERSTVRRADLMVAICPDLADHVQTIAPGRSVAMIENAAPEDLFDQVESSLRLKRPDERLVLYIGTLEENQGIDLLIASFLKVAATVPDVRLALVGGTMRQMERYGAAVPEELKPRVEFHLPRPTEEMGSILAQADILVSPRTRGTNTPLKIYSYLRAGKAILATDLATHRQVLNDEVALLVAPECPAFAEGLGRLLGDPRMREHYVAAAEMLFETRYSRRVFTDRFRTLLAQLDPSEEQGEKIASAHGAPS